jgi:hypothetical protein
MPEGWLWEPDAGGFVRMFGKKTGFCVSVNMLGRLLATQRLAIVPAAEVTTPEERAVLDAWPLLSEDARESALTELARRKP